MVAPGYKETEVGVIPKDWDVRSVSSFAVTIASGRSLVTPNRGDYPVYGSTGVIGHTASPDYRGKAILIARVGANAGKLALVEGRYGVTDNTIMLKTDESVSLDFVWRQLQAKRLNSLVFGSGQPLLTGTQIKDLCIPIPPHKNEESAIASALSDVDDLTESLEQLIAKKRAIKTGTMQQLLTPPGQPGHKRLPGFSGEWKAVNMGRDATLKARIGWQALTTAEYRDTGTHYLVTGTDFWNGKVRWNTCCFVSKWRYDQDHNIQLRPDDVLLTKDGTIGKVGYVDSLPGPATLNSGVFVIRPLARAFCPRFLFYVLTSRIFVEFLILISAGSTINHLYQKDFTSFSFLAPAEPEQEAIAEILSDIDAEIEALEARLEKTRAIKQGMMQELLTGRTRLL